jgi:hypothetical protein
MSHFWGKLVRLAPKFAGTDLEKEQNLASHNWRVVYLVDRFHEVKDPRIKVTECSICQILSDSELASYSCGTAPITNSLENMLREKGPILRP